MSDYMNVLKNVKAIDQTVFESQLINKADKAYKSHVDDEKQLLVTEQISCESNIKKIKNMLIELNDAVCRHVESSRASFSDFEKIKNSLNNQIILKKTELVREERHLKKTQEQLKSLELSEKLCHALDGAGRAVEPPRKVAEVEEIETEDGYGSDRTMVYDDEEEERLEEVRQPVIKRQRMSELLELTEDEPTKKKRRQQQPQHTEGLCDDSAVGDYKRRLGHEQTNADEEEGVDLGSGFSASRGAWERLYDYQKTGVLWLLQFQNGGGGGGILGDEMGLGKTIQVLVYLAGLYASRGAHYDVAGASLVVCPATVVRQWLNESHKWSPRLRVGVLHSTGPSYSRPERLIDSIAGGSNHGGALLVTTYSSALQHATLLKRHQWAWLILDEGHKIKNPHAKVTCALKQLPAQHRLVLSGSPLQNDLKELWSLVDFVQPGRLGQLASFQATLALPIARGGYEHASPIQVETAYRCACLLRDALSSLMLRRTKADVQLQLPRKTEQVLFCSPTPHQTVVYREYLASRQCARILAHDLLPFPGLAVMRKICNHPDLVTGGPRSVMDHPILGFAEEEEEQEEEHDSKSGTDDVADTSPRRTQFGHFARSGKMVVTRDLLRVWRQHDKKEAGHKVLLFVQGRVTLLVLARMLRQEGHPHLIMHGGTPVAARHDLVHRFNTAPASEVFIFLLTTRVGGLGLNLTGADRVLVFDPDWNPCTDLQARERAWRIGQNRKVIVYRLVTSGTVEERIYHRQIYKQFLTNRVLKNPRQRRFFKTQDLRDLFRLDEKGSESDTAIVLGRKRKLARNGDGVTRSSNFFDGGVVMCGSSAAAAAASALAKVGGEGVDEEEVAEVEGVCAGVTSVDDLVRMDGEEEQREEEVEMCVEDMDEEKLRRRARRLSRLLTKLQQQEEQEQQPSEQVKVEGVPVKNLDRSAVEARAAPVPSQLVAVGPECLESRREAVAAALTAKQREEAQSAAQRAVGACLNMVVAHDQLLEDETPDPALQEASVRGTAMAALSWLRGKLVRAANQQNHHQRGAGLGRATNCRLYQAKQHRRQHRRAIRQMEGSLLNTDSCHTRFHGSDIGVNQHVRFPSSLLLAVIASRNGHSTSSLTVVGQSETSALLIGREVKSLIGRLHAYLIEPRRHQRPPTTQKLVARFKDSLAPGTAPLFRALLEGMCCSAREDSIGLVWRLRSEFQLSDCDV